MIQSSGITLRYYFARLSTEAASLKLDGEFCNILPNPSLSIIQALLGRLQPALPHAQTGTQ